ncbi:MAG: hypothetical protein ABI164_03435, partial [Acidobacteriaceae bacterium]
KTNMYSIFAPAWVSISRRTRRTGSRPARLDRSSYTFVIETDATRARGPTRAFNHYQRKLGFNPVQPGTHPWMDTLKAEAMLPDLLVRKAARRLRAKLDS